MLSDKTPIVIGKQTAAILKGRAAEVPKDLLPILEALRQFKDGEEITAAQLNECLDVVAASGAKSAHQQNGRRECVLRRN